MQIFKIILVHFEEFSKQTYGTGSWPWPPHGLQLKIRLADSQLPFITPCFNKASLAYCEQVGV